MSNRLGGFIAGQNINVSIGTFTASLSPDLTFTSASATPAVGQPVQFVTTGTLPTGFSLNTTYYVISKTSNTCQVSTTQGGSATTYTNSTGSGTHSAVVPRTFNPYAGVTPSVEYLIVAGGGAGSGSYTTGNGGGGAGGLLQGTYSVTPATGYTITVGSGGVGVYSFSSVGANGTDSVFGPYTATGGGGGGCNNTGYPGANGGSGGGGGISVGSGTSGQGYAGGAVSGDYGGGGGGAGSVGGAATTYRNGNGGAGVCSSITGQRVFYAGGGGGGGQSNSGSIGGQGSCGGGNGGYPDNAGLGNGFPGLANTGGGGGAGSKAAGGGPIGGSGGSGIVVIRYPQIYTPPALVTGSPQVRYADGYQIYIWTSSGSVVF